MDGNFGRIVLWYTQTRNPSRIIQSRAHCDLPLEEAILLLSARAQHRNDLQFLSPLVSFLSPRCFLRTLLCG